MLEPRILFVCLHGAAKSVLAARRFERLAAARGLRAQADFAGTEPDPEIAPRLVKELLGEGIDVRALRPRRLTQADVAAASRVITFGCDVAAPDGVKRDMLPFPPGDGSHVLQLPQPKLPNHAKPCGSMVTPKPVPRSPPPFTGERGVPFLPSAGWPFGSSTTATRLESGVPCFVLFVTQA